MLKFLADFYQKHKTNNFLRHLKFCWISINRLSFKKYTFIELHLSIISLKIKFRNYYVYLKTFPFPKMSSERKGAKKYLLSLGVLVRAQNIYKRSMSFKVLFWKPPNI